MRLRKARQPYSFRSLAAILLPHRNQLIARPAFATISNNRAEIKELFGDDFEYTFAQRSMRWRHQFQLRWRQSNGECFRIGQCALVEDVEE